MRGHAGLVAGRFMKAFGSPHRLAWDPFGPDAMLAANAAVYGVRDLPEHDLANARYLLSFSGDFLETGISPCTTRGVRPDAGRPRDDPREGPPLRTRLSMTAASADLFVPCAPGTEGFVALGIAHVMVRDRLTAASTAAGRLADDLGAWSPEEVEKRTGVHARDIAAAAEEFFPEPAGLAIAGTAARDRPRRGVPLRRRCAPERPRGERGEARRGVVPEPGAGVREVRGGGRPARPLPGERVRAMRAALEKMRGGAFRMAILAGATNPAFTSRRR